MNALDPCPDDLLARAGNAPLAPADPTPWTPAPNPPRQPSPRLDLDRLLSDARAARARGDNARARTLYTRVVRLAPGTPAAAVAQVAIGLMLVERAEGGDARAAL